MGARQVIAVEPQKVLAESLEKKYKKDERVVVIDSAVGAFEGWGKMYICSSATSISTLDDDWRTRGRLCGYAWDQETKVWVTTLDILIATYGIPSYIKVDVEGWEKNVFSALSHPVDVLAFEFTPEFLGNARQCVDRILELGDYVFSYELIAYGMGWYETKDDLFGSITADIRMNERIWGKIYALRRELRDVY
jgi:FkbM family methyltransferase